MFAPATRAVVEAADEKLPRVRTAEIVSMRKSAGKNEGAGLETGIPIPLNDCVYGTEVESEIEA